MPAPRLPEPECSSSVVAHLLPSLVQSAVVRQLKMGILLPYTFLISTIFGSDIYHCRRPLILPNGIQNSPSQIGRQNSVLLIYITRLDHISLLLLPHPRLVTYRP